MQRASSYHITYIFSVRLQALSEAIYLIWFNVNIYRLTVIKYQAKIPRKIGLARILLTDFAIQNFLTSHFILLTVFLL